MIVMKPSIKIVKFMFPGSEIHNIGWGCYDRIMKMHLILEDLILY